VQPGVAYPPPPRSGSENPTAQYRVQLGSDGKVNGVTLTSSSGNAGFDRAVETGIRRCNPFPKPSTGRYEPIIDVVYRMYD
jgi:colicin import membrane protein